MVELRVVVIEAPSPKTLRRLLQRHRVLAVALVLEVENRRQLSGLARHYRARPLSLPPELLLEWRGSSPGGA